MEYLPAIVSITIVSLISLIGVLFLWINEIRLKKANTVLVSIAIGSMLGDSFIHLLPEAFAQGPSRSVSIAIIAGFMLFFVFEKFLHWQHEHVPGHTHPVGTLSLVADAIHNCMDGIVIGAAYMISPTVGVATTIAVIFHEIPQEIGEFGILLKAGFSRHQALLFNLLSSFAAFIGLGIAILLGDTLNNFSHLMLAFTAGGFVYIAGSDLIPELHREPDTKHTLLEFTAILIGLITMYGLSFLE